MEEESLIDQLYDDIRALTQSGVLGGSEFLPINIVDEIVTAERLRAAFQEEGEEESAGLADEIAKFGRKVFTILVILGESKLMLSLWRQGLRDEHLPLKPASTRGKLAAENGNDGLFTVGNAGKTSQFLAKQWTVLAPIIDGSGRHFSLNANRAMPFISSDEVDGGYYSAVYKCEIHQAHQKGLQALVAVKQFIKTGNQTAFEQETYNLKALAQVVHPHVIRYYATCDIDNTYFVLFPWADGGNLWQFWTQENSKSITEIWMLEQMIGLSEALEQLHEVNCRHGDLKPANILRFHASSNPILVIGDVGIARIHIEDTFLRKDGTTTLATTPSYQGPEVVRDPLKPRSRLYDIWSFGCIFLEFVTWYLHGFKSLESFQRERVATDNFSYFYDHQKDGDTVIHPAVIKQFSGLLNDPRGNPNTSLGALIGLIKTDLLQLDLDKRIEARDVALRLREILLKAKGNDPASENSRLGYSEHAKRPVNHGQKDSVIEAAIYT